jgi:hypothetical protein
MRPACSIRKGIRVLLISASLLGMCGCQKKIDPITLGEWLKELDEKAGISQFSQKEPYFSEIDETNEAYAYVQAAVEWKIIRPEDDFELEQDLDRQWAAYTLSNLTNEAFETKAEIKDIASSPFQEEIRHTVDLGWMELKADGRFGPDQIVEREEAEKMLDQAAAYINHRTFDTAEPKIETKNGSRFLEAEPSVFNEASLQAIYGKDRALQIGDIVHWTDQKGREFCYQIIEQNEENEQCKVSFKNIDIEDEIDSLQLSGNEDLDFSQADIFQGGNEVQEQASHRDSAEEHLQNAAIRSLQKTFSFHDFNIELTASGSSLAAKVYRSMPYGTEIAAQVILNHVHIDYAWNSVQKDLRNAYFRIDFQSEEDLQIENEQVKKLYGDFSKVSSDHFLSSLKDLYQAKNDADETSIEICRIVLPIPSAPVLHIDLSLELRLGITGKAQLSLIQKNAVGFETKDGAMRFIKENTGKADASIKASAKLLSGINFDFCLLNGTLMDAGIEAGAQANVKTTAHLYDEDGNMNDVQTDLPGDIAEQAAEENENVLICTDITAHWVADVNLNSSSTLAGRFGFGREYELLNEDNAPLIPGLNAHFENGQKVDACTRKSRKHLPTAEGIAVAKHICLKAYSFTVHQGSTYQIEITALPEGYEKKDLVYESSHPDAATVDANGTVSGHSAGSTVIAVKTSDGKHQIHCNGMVPTVQ